MIRQPLIFLKINHLKKFASLLLIFHHATFQQPTKLLVTEVRAVAMLLLDPAVSSGMTLKTCFKGSLSIRVSVR
jgi:hypothetical protein